MDLFDIFSAVGETYINTKNDMKHNNDYIEVLADNFLKSKKKIDKMYDDEIKRDNKRSNIFLDLFK